MQKWEMYVGQLVTHPHPDQAGKIFKVTRIKIAKAFIQTQDGRGLEGRIEDLSPAPEGTVWDGAPVAAKVVAYHGNPYDWNLGTVVTWTSRPDNAYVVLWQDRTYVRLALLGHGGDHNPRNRYQRVLPDELELRY